MWKVEIWEYERGWGSRLDEVKEFKTQPEAVQFQKVYNSKNTEAIVPDWYMVAKEPYHVEDENV